MTDLGLPLALVIWFAVSSGYFSLMGTSVAESHRSRLEKLSDEGSADAQAAIKIIDEPDKLINTAQAGFALSSTLAGLLSALLAPYILTVISGIRFDWFIAVVIAFIIAAAIVLTVGMFIPKAVARHNPEKCLLEHYEGFNWAATLLTPVTFVLDKIT
ncbi:MAG: DUF21 domain-containing protein, partial [Selenomonadaceae bacterium]|nr:DUF21 domain-containing protein [Selenomonadaceae bacterium]